MLHLKGLDNRRSEAAFAKSRGFGSCAGIRIGRRKSGGKPPHSKMSAQGQPRAGGFTVSTASWNLRCRKQKRRHKSRRSREKIRTLTYKLAYQMI